MSFDCRESPRLQPTCLMLRSMQSDIAAQRYFEPARTTTLGQAGKDQRNVWRFTVAFCSLYWPAIIPPQAIVFVFVGSSIPARLASIADGGCAQENLLEIGSHDVEAGTDQSSGFRVCRPQKSRPWSTFSLVVAWTLSSSRQTV
ncbi:hypothetical protein K458DRAFT_385259 [Lentithecium fluviatile CBS 122367]|uniref:Uncharacterized protein n=1 Tax=Lentithecium fluviatile CBS 122367 TaxID=1168545 RepID=A0A6G1JBZ3_9PLEO|nr:hypothetical protein K458DRAFT_385259 [Lentithecium fluviatile CBS 122367]